MLDRDSFAIVLRLTFAHFASVRRRLLVLVIDARSTTGVYYEIVQALGMISRETVE